MDSNLVLTECFSRRIRRFTTSSIDLIHSERASSSPSSFLVHCLAYASHASMIISKFWCHENETGSLNFGPLCKGSLSLSFCTILRYPVTKWLVELSLLDKSVSPKSNLLAVSRICIHVVYTTELVYNCHKEDIGIKSGIHLRYNNDRKEQLSN